MRLTDLDKRIINALQNDGRLSYRQLSKIVKSSPSTIMHHVHELEKEGVITGYSAKIDYDKTGHDIHVIVEMKIAKGKFAEVGKKIASHPGVLAIYDHTGAFDATVIARFRNKRAMNIFLKTVQAYEYVERTETKLVLNALKEEGIKIR